MITTFVLTAEQEKLAREWIESRELTSPSRRTAIGGRFTFAFTPTSVGVIAVVKDVHDDAKLDLTDYDNW